MNKTYTLSTRTIEKTTTQEILQVVKKDFKIGKFMGEMVVKVGDKVVGWLEYPPAYKPEDKLVLVLM